jgi:acylpyruvate hydrolase
LRLVTFVRGDRRRLGVLVATGGVEHVLDVERLDPSLPSDMRGFLALGGNGLERLARLLSPGGDSRPTGRPAVSSFDPLGFPDGAVLRRTDVTLGPVVPDPAKLICIGLNYRDHAAETKQALPEVPTVFAKYPNVLIGAGAPIVVPRMSSKIDYEAELAFVIGRRARHVPEAEALGCVAGYTCFNDVTARDVQKRSPQWTLGKSFDTFGPLGPALVTADQVPDPHALAIRCSVDGETLQESSTGAMVFSVARLVSFLSEVMTLEPGDVVATGTPAGVGFVRDPPRYLRPGETVRVEIEGVGVLENPVVAEAVA